MKWRQQETAAALVSLAPGKLKQTFQWLKQRKVIICVSAAQMSKTSGARTKTELKVFPNEVQNLKPWKHFGAKVWSDLLSLKIYYKSWSFCRCWAHCGGNKNKRTNTTNKFTFYILMPSNWKQKRNKVALKFLFLNVAELETLS